MQFTRQEILTHLNKLIAAGIPIIGGGAGNGISAKCQENGGVDLLIIYNSGHFRMNGRGSLAGSMPYGDANAIVMDMAGEVLTITKNTPVIAGVCGTDPTRIMSVFLKQIKDTGFSGVQNFPTVGLCDGLFRKNLEETGMSYSLEVDMIRHAHEIGLFTTPYAFNAEEATAMAKAGADVIVAHMGLTTKGVIGGASTTFTLEQSAVKVQEICDAAKKVNSNVIIMCHGGEIATPEDAEYILKNTTMVDGFYGASSVERLPTEVAITDQMKKFKSISIK